MFQVLYNIFVNVLSSYGSATVKSSQAKKGYFTSSSMMGLTFQSTSNTGSSFSVLFWLKLTFTYI